MVTQLWNVGRVKVTNWISESKDRKKLLTVTNVYYVTKNTSAVRSINRAEPRNTAGVDHKHLPQHKSY